MVYVQRNGQNAISAVFAVAQYEAHDAATPPAQWVPIAIEFLADNDPAVLAFLNPPQTPDQIKIAAIKANARRQALVAAIQSMDDAALIAYINANVTDLPSARTMLANLALLVAGVIRS